MKRTLLLLAACIVAVRCLQNIDVQQPIVRIAPSNLNVEGYFGYRVLLHRADANPETFEEYLDGTILIVAAPNGTRSNSDVPNTGFVYQCPITVDGQCTRIQPLSDDSENDDFEWKQGQFMGGAIASSGGRFIACAHRYVNIDPGNTNTRSVFGRCFHSDRSMNSFTEFQPCVGVGRRLTSSVGVCQAGTSAVVASNSQGVDHIAVGAPGTYLWRGIIIRHRPGTNIVRFQPSDSVGDSAFSWQGYSLIKGFFRNLNTEDFATSAPRLGSYFGAVNIVQNTDNLQLVSQNLVGEQMGEYYGFALAALNLAGSDLHELVVSAPMYRDFNRGAETGRIYVYLNNGGVLNQEMILLGQTAYSRFGHAMVSLGDISGDGFDDLAVSAPFEGSGVVYIYHSSPSQIISPTPQQIITPDSLNLIDDIISRFMSFGSSLDSLDVDGNGVNDLAIGSYYDQTVVILRTRPLAQIVTTLTAVPGVVDLNNDDSKVDYNGEMHTTFDVLLTVEYIGSGSITLDIELIAESARSEQGLQQRLFFDDGANNMKPATDRREDFEADSGMRQVLSFTVFVENGISDILTGFIIDLRVNAQDFDQPTSDGNVDPVNLQEFPVVSIIGPDSVPVEILTDCDSRCLSNLSVAQNGDITYRQSDSTELDELTVGLVTEVVVPLTIKNTASNAFLAQLIFSLPIQQLGGFSGINDTSITCNPGNGNGQVIPYICDLGNPFQSSEVRNVELTFIPSNSLTGGEGNILIAFNVTSLNEDPDVRADNAIQVTLEVNTEADIFVDEGVVVPDQVSHNVTAPSSVETVSDLGAEFVTTFTVGNSGPSTIPNSKLTIYWPLTAGGSNQYILYPASWAAIQSTSVSVTCDNTYFNQEMLDIATSEDDEILPFPDGRRKRSASRSVRRRKRRSVRLPRQDMEDLPISNEVTLSCAPDDQGIISNNHTCVAIECNIRQLGAGSRIQVEIAAVIDERYLGGNPDTFTFITAAKVETVDASHITEGDEGNNMARATFRSLPGGQVVVRGEEREGSNQTVPWYAIVVPIIITVIFIIIIAVVLYFCGFFRRKTKTELEEQARENLTEADGNT